MVRCRRVRAAVQSWRGAVCARRDEEEQVRTARAVRLGELIRSAFRSWRMLAAAVIARRLKRTRAIFTQWYEVTLCSAVQCNGTQRVFSSFPLVFFLVTGRRGGLMQRRRNFAMLKSCLVAWRGYTHRGRIEENGH